MKDTFRKYVNWMMALRAVIALTMFLSALIIQFLTNSEFPLVIPLIRVVTAIFLLTLIYAIFAVKFGSSRIFAFIQITGDVLTITAFVTLTGGTDSSFSFLYMISIITASTLLYRKGALYTASISAICYGTLINLIYYGKLPYIPYIGILESNISVERIFYNLVANIGGFFVVALLSSRLAMHIKLRDDQLESQSIDLANLMNLHQDVINSMPSGLATVDMKGNITYMNDRGKYILNLDGNSLGENILRYIPLEPDIFEFCNNCSESQPQRYEVSLGNLFSDAQYLGITISALLSAEKKQIGFLVIFQDLTDLKELERELRVKDRMAVLGEMAAGLAHEIRNPLASMKGSVQVLQKALKLEGDDKELLNIIVKESLRLNDTIEDFLTYAKGSHFKPEKIDICQLFSESILLVKHSEYFTDEHELKLGKVDDKITIVADSHQLRQLIWNLSLNALQAMPDKGILEIKLMPRLEEDVVEIIFKDNGKGIAKDEVSHIFQPFKSSNSRGLGLGLSIVYRIVEDHGGSIRVDSKINSGTKFTIRLPLTPAKKKEYADEGD